MRVLIIEDEPSIAFVLRKYMEPFADEVTIATKWGEAIIQLSDHELFDIITLDLGLPDMMPEDTIKQIKTMKEQSPDCLLIVVSGYVNLAPEAMNQGADGFLSKQDTFKTGGGFINKVKEICNRILGEPVKYERNLEMLERVARKFNEGRSARTSKNVTHSPSPTIESKNVP